MARLAVRVSGIFASRRHRYAEHMTFPDRDRLQRNYNTARDLLLAKRTPHGYWVGELSTSALSTATAISALALTQQRPDLIERGAAWLADHQNADGGWGDTDRSFSNISTTMLGRAAFHLTGTAARHSASLQRANAYMSERHGQSAAEQAEAVRRRYGRDRTFAVPILTTCALAGLVSWREVPSLPFELACFPQSWFRLLRLPVVSYALPALIAIGQAVHHHRPSWNPLARLVRRLAISKSLRVLETIQPSSGGFLEATPLTSFVTLSLASIGLADHVVARKGVQFIVDSVQLDGSWPIDTNLATWVTTLSVNALAAAGQLEAIDRRAELLDWLLRQQFTERHPYTGADPGGWGWSDLPGSVPDADDTPGALLALAGLAHDEPILPPMGGQHVPLAVDWLLNLQNSDGGWPTFCRGWTNLPFDRSGPDLTAHTLRALAAWRASITIPPEFLAGTEKGRFNDAGLFYQWIVKRRPGMDRAVERGFAYLARAQRPDGSWLPLWFGNQNAPDDVNPTYGTTRVLAAYRDLDMMHTDPARRGVAWLLTVQNADGGWGGAANVPSSVEETALAVDVLLDTEPAATSAVNKGLTWLVGEVEAGGLNNPTPIGFYFAKLWYYETLYPMIFTVAALGRALRRMPVPPA